MNFDEHAIVGKDVCVGGSWGETRYPSKVDLLLQGNGQIMCVYLLPDEADRLAELLRAQAEAQRAGSLEEWRAKCRAARAKRKARRWPAFRWWVNRHAAMLLCLFGATALSSAALLVALYGVAALQRC
ncbi:hypothetical protein C8245_14010 [Paracidovorax avenae]|uniref:hypothetical protein n=1 Tax=Paracidovorax avenae TaxID=80867 RepID=UPI000D20A2D2|nr:hypothetical protein [Paracidovorax avenae]AVS66647.1 hypothetical protein C8245_14010 [Paracidovorax avenae]